MNVTWAPELTLGLCKERAERRQCPEIRLAQRTSWAGGLQGKQYVEDVEDEVHGLCNGLQHPLLTDRVWGMVLVPSSTAEGAQRLSLCSPACESYVLETQPALGVGQPCKSALAHWPRPAREWPAPKEITSESSLKVQPEDWRSLCLFPSASPGCQNILGV